MIAKILDKYYLLKLKDRFNDLKKEYFLDFKIKTTRDGLTLKAKPKKYKDYTNLLFIKSEDSINYLINFDGIREYIKKQIKFLKENDWK